MYKLLIFWKFFFFFKEWNKTYGLASLLRTFNIGWDRICTNVIQWRAFIQIFSVQKNQVMIFFLKNPVYILHTHTSILNSLTLRWKLFWLIWQRWGRFLVFLEFFVFISFTLFLKCRHKTYTYFKIQSIPWHFLPKFPLVFNMSGFSCYWAFDSFW